MESMKKAAGLLQAQGRHGDTILAHINPDEAKMLKAAGGSGTINPKTGLVEYGWWTSIRNAIQTVAVVAGNYFLPGSSIVTSQLVSKDSQDQLNSTLGQVATMASGVYGGSVGNLGNYGRLLSGQGLTGMDALSNGVSNASDWLDKLSDGTAPGNVASKAGETVAKSAAGQAGVSTNASEFLRQPAMSASYTAPEIAATSATSGTSGSGLLGKLTTWAGNNPTAALMAGQTVMAGIGGAATAEANAEQARLNREAQLDMHTVKGGFQDKGPRVADPNLVTDMTGRYIRGPKVGQYAPGRAPGLLNSGRV